MIADVLERLRALLFRRRWNRDLDDEVQFHLEQDVVARIRAGADPATARREARLAFGGVDRYKEATRDANGVRALEDTLADTRFALRALRRNPAFTATAVGVLALAIGAAAAVFTVIHAVLIAQLPYPHADRLVRVYQYFGTPFLGTISVVDHEAIRDQQKTMDAFGTARWGVATLTGLGQPEAIPVVRVTSGVFRALSTTPAAGRLIEPGDDPVSAPPVVVVSDEFATKYLGGKAVAVGRSVTLDGKSHTVIGVLPPGVVEIAGMRSVAWPVLQMATPTRRGPFGYRGIGRLKEGVTLDAAVRDLAGISERIYPLWESGFRDKNARLRPYPLRESIVGRSTGQLSLFAGAVVLVLLVAIANVATLVLVRAAARQHELSVRATLGASRPRLARLVVTESLVLMVAAGVVGFVVAALGLKLVGVIAPELPRAREIALNGGTALVAAALAIISGLLVSISPVAAVLGGTILTDSPTDTRRSGGGRRTGLVRGLLVASEFALAVPLLLAAALLANSFLRLQRVPLGYDAESSFEVRLGLPSQRYPDGPAVPAFWRRAIQAALETPGVEAAGLSTAAPPDNQGDVNNFNLVAHPVPSGGNEHVSPWAPATPGYFTALGIPLLDGRMFNAGDTVGDSLTGPPLVALVSRSWAARYFPGEQVIGQQMIEGGCYECPRTIIIGIVGDVKYQGLDGGGDGVYVPLEQANPREATLFVRTRGAPAGFIQPVLQALRRLDPDLPLTGAPLRDQVKSALADPGRWTAVLTAFAAVALALSALGIFGLMSYVVRRQRREIGVRMALGAEPRQVTGMIVARGMRFVLTGTVVGLGLAMLEGRWLSALLYDVTPRDPFTTAAVAVLLLVSALVACLLPGIRAARIRPMEAIVAE
jgi:putative ABC transport system permease protein